MCWEGLKCAGTMRGAGHGWYGSHLRRGLTARPDLAAGQVHVGTLGAEEGVRLYGLQRNGSEHRRHADAVSRGGPHELALGARPWVKTHLEVG